MPKAAVVVVALFYFLFTATFAQAPADDYFQHFEDASGDTSTDDSDYYFENVTSGDYDYSSTTVRDDDLFADVQWLPTEPGSNAETTTVASTTTTFTTTADTVAAANETSEIGILGRAAYYYPETTTSTTSTTSTTTTTATTTSTTTTSTSTTTASTSTTTTSTSTTTTSTSATTSSTSTTTASTSMTTTSTTTTTTSYYSFDPETTTSTTSTSTTTTTTTTATTTCSTTTASTYALPTTTTSTTPGYTYGTTTPSTPSANGPDHPTRSPDMGMIKSYENCFGMSPGMHGKDKRCIFPFIYRGIVYDSCTFVADTQPWCATEVDANGHLVTNDWGYCTAECDVEPHNPCQTIEGGPVVGAYCRFPFRYKDVEYNMCTSVDHQLTPDAIEAGQEEEGWCATKVDAHGDYIPHHWGLCQPECKPPKTEPPKCSCGPECTCGCSTTTNPTSSATTPLMVPSIMMFTDTAAGYGTTTTKGTTTTTKGTTTTTGYAYPGSTTQETTTTTKGSTTTTGYAYPRSTTTTTKGTTTTTNGITRSTKGTTTTTGYVYPGSTTTTTTKGTTTTTGYVDPWSWLGEMDVSVTTTNSTSTSTTITTTTTTMPPCVSRFASCNATCIDGLCLTGCGNDGRCARYCDLGGQQPAHCLDDCMEAPEHCRGPEPVPCPSDKISHPWNQAGLPVATYIPKAFSDPILNIICDAGIPTY